MAVTYTEHTSRRLSVGTLPDTEPTIAASPAYANFSTITFKYVPGITGCSPSNSSSEKDVTDLGSNGYRKMLQETFQLSLAIVIQFQLDSETDALPVDGGHQIIADAANGLGVNNLVWVRYDFPNAAAAAAADDNNDPSTTAGNDPGRVAIFKANVSGGDLGIGGGGSNGGYEESAYTFKSFGQVYYVPLPAP